MADPVGQVSSEQSTLSDWAAPYVTDVIGRGNALAELPYTPYTGPLSAGQSELQNQAFSGIAGLQNASRLSKAGAYGGSRQAIMDSETQRNLLNNLSGITARGYNTAYDRAERQFNTEQNRLRDSQRDTNKYGLDALRQMSQFGDTQRNIEKEGIAADYAQFKEERDFPYKQNQYAQSLLQGLPVEAMAREYIEPSELSEILGYGGTLAEIINILRGKT